MKFLSLEVALYIYKSSLRPCMKYCCHIWAGAPSCYLELLHKLQKRISTTVSSSLHASLEPLEPSCVQVLVDVHLNWPWFNFLVPKGDLIVILIHCMICHYVYVNSFFPHAAKFWNFLSTECFPLTYDLNGFKSRTDFLLSLCTYFSYNSMPRSGCSALHGKNPY